MWSLFDTRGGSSAGYRLKTLEVFNWGTFHEGSQGQDIWKISPNGQNSLLTGANGSGKTTLVDGLLALLVMPTKRFFNQSSGAQKRGERSEESYMEGYYGRTQTDGQTTAKTEKLRPNRLATYSIILGVFEHSSAGTAPVTLVQVRWFSNSGLQRKYLVARLELSIAEHIQFSSDGNWLRRLKRQYGDRLDDFDTFPKYADRFSRLFGMRSDKALTLFNQTVGMKVLGDLDEFIRTNMLEEAENEAAFKKLWDNYQTLLTAWLALEKARTQLTLLEPIYARSHDYDALERRRQRTEQQQQALDPWFAREQIRLWQDERTRQDRELTRLDDKLTTQDRHLETLDGRRVEMEVQLGTDQIEQQIKALDKAIKELEESRKAKERDAADYNRLARKLGLAEDPDESLFQQNIEQAEALRGTLADEKSQLDNQRITTQIRRREQQKVFDGLTADITQLKGSSSKVTGRSATNRAELLAAVGATEADIPFMAEVMQVRSDEKPRWNEAIEKVLHSPGLDLLVPKTYLSAVTEWINNHPDLKGKMVVHEVSGKPPKPLFPDPRSVVTKLEFNPKSPYAAWVEEYVGTRYNYICVESRAEYERMTEKALLPSGLNRNRLRHERDDSPARQPILGWDNRDLLREKQRAAHDLSEGIGKLDKALTTIGKTLQANDERATQLALLLGIQQFSKLDWRSDVLQINNLTQRRTDLDNSNQAHKTLKAQLEAAKNELGETRTARQITHDHYRDTEKLLERLAAEQRAAEQTLANADIDDLALLDEPTRDLCTQLTYAGFSKQKALFEQQMAQTLAQLTTERTALERDIRGAMTAYRSPDRATREKFPDWDSDFGNLKAEIDQLPEYVDRYEQIRNERVVELDTRFRDEFKSGATKALTDYCGALELQHEGICDIVDQINKSLCSIVFNLSPDTYIQLERKDTVRPRIRDFRFGKLNSWQPDRTALALAPNSKEAEIEHFVTRVQPFINELNSNPAWRQEVTDVRNWSEFRAREYYMADHAPKDGGTYDNSGSLSGGEAAQLAYTVLGAAIAYQFGINSDGQGQRSFRFIVVDEAFSKLDEEKSNYLLQLCRGLGLQLMVVTPLTSIHILENDVSVIHWVTKSQQDRRKSTVRDIPILTYTAQKETLLAEDA